MHSIARQKPSYGRCSAGWTYSAPPAGGRLAASLPLSDFQASSFVHPGLASFPLALNPHREIRGHATAVGIVVLAPHSIVSLSRLLSLVFFSDLLSLIDESPPLCRRIPPLGSQPIGLLAANPSTSILSCWRRWWCRRYGCGTLQASTQHPWRRRRINTSSALIRCIISRLHFLVFTSSFYRAMLCIARTMLSRSVCPSVCL